MVDPSCQEGPRNEVLQHLKPAVAPGIKMPLKHFLSPQITELFLSPPPINHTQEWLGQLALTSLWSTDAGWEQKLWDSSLCGAISQSEEYFTSHFSTAQPHQPYQRATALQQGL